VYHRVLDPNVNDRGKRNTGTVPSMTVTKKRCPLMDGKPCVRELCGFWFDAENMESACGVKQIATLMWYQTHKND
jgi:hypothetical protein